MNTRSTPSWSITACWILASGLVGLVGPVAAQDGEKRELTEEDVVEEDLGDGFRAVSVRGGPPAIIDDNTGMILKEAYGRPLIHDPETGATLYLNDDGEPVLKQSGKGAQGGDTDRAEQAKRVERMKAFMQRAQGYRSERKDVAPGKRGKGTNPAKQRAKQETLTWDAVVDGHLQLLGADEESKQILAPRLRAVVLKLDEIRRSSAPRLRPGVSAKTTLPGSNPLPGAIRSYLSAFASSQKSGQTTGLEPLLTAYRQARTAQDTELAELSDALRELLTVTQEARLVAVGVLR